MFSALKRNREESFSERDASARLVRLLLEKVEESVVKGPVWDNEWLQLRYAELRTNLEKAITGAEVAAIAMQAVDRLKEYNEAVTRHYLRQSAAFDSGRKLLGRALTWAKAENDADNNRGQTLMELLERSKGVGDLAAMAVRVSKATNFVREEWTNRRRQNAQTIAQFQEEVNQTYAELQPEQAKATEPEPAESPVEPPTAGAPQSAAASVVAEPEVPVEEDPITGLPGRPAAERAISKAQASKRPHFIAMISIDQLGMVTDRYGDKMAEEVLFYFGQQYAQGLDSSDTLYRWGRCTFVVLLEREGSKEWIRGQIDRLFNLRFRKNAFVNDRSVMLNVGVSWRLWAPNEMVSFEATVKQLTDFEKGHTRDK